MLALAALVGVSHVPTYVGGAENCFTPPRHHATSQVIYLKGSGGLELHITSPTEPFDIPGNEIIDVDAVFKKKYDQSTYSLYVGCGGCVATQDPIVINPVTLSGYEHAEVEPFTQTVYYSVFPKAERKYNASLLDGCSQNHFTIRVLDHNNRTGGEALVWGAVIGLGETFTFMELLEFPIYVIRNHGDTWNGMGWTVFFSFIIWAPLFVWSTRYVLKLLNVPVVELNLYFTVEGWRVYIDGRWAARELLYTGVRWHHDRGVHAPDVCAVGRASQLRAVGWTVRGHWVCQRAAPLPGRDRVGRDEVQARRRLPWMQ
jgi:hypothetical protein